MNGGTELQVAKDIRDEYSWDTLANMIYERNQSHGYTVSQLAELYDKRPKDIQQLLEMRHYAIEFMNSRGIPDHWSAVVSHQHAFQEIVKGRQQQKTLADKRAFQLVAFQLLDQPGEAGGRLYAQIGRVSQHLSEILTRLKDELPESEGTAPSTGDDPSGFFSGGEKPEISDVLLDSVQEVHNGETVRSVVRDVLADAAAKERKAHTANFVRARVQSANTELQSAIAAINEQSSRTGVKEQIESIEQVLVKLREWLDADA